jgi:hypothetical protein
MADQINFPPGLVRDVADTVSGKVSESLGVAREDMDEAMKAQIQATVQSTLEKRFATEVVSATESKVGQTAIGGVDIASAISSKVALGKRAMEAMLATDELGQILKKNAELLKRKYDALVDAGFTVEQAFRLLEAEIYSKGAARPR